MGFLSGILGTQNTYNSGASGPQSVALGAPVTGQATGTSQQQAQASLAQQQALVNQLQGQNGIQNQSNVYNQLQGVANGTGPNPAQAQLAQATGANVANQAALMAGQRGSGANVGLLAREAAQQGAGTQQQAAGQATTMQANQSLNAINSMGGLANQQASNQLNQANTTSQAAQGLYNTNLQGQLAQNQQALGQQQQINNINAGSAAANQATNAAITGGVLNATGAAIGGKHAAGGMIEAQPYADGGSVKSHVHNHFNKGGKVKALLSPGERYLPPKDVKKVASGKEDPMKAGSKVPGKAKVSGDSLKNDVVPAKLKEGGIVIPRSVINSENPKKAASDFVNAVLAKKGLR